MHYDTVIGGGAGRLVLAAQLGRRVGRKSAPAKVLLVDRPVLHI